MPINVIHFPLFVAESRIQCFKTVSDHDDDATPDGLSGVDVVVSGLKRKIEKGVKREIQVNSTDRAEDRNSRARAKTMVFR